MPLPMSYALKAFDRNRESILDDDCLSYVINAKFLVFDLELFSTKWFDYRQLTPFQATMHYVEAYGKVYRAFYAMERDRAAAEFIRVDTVDFIVEGLRNGDSKVKKRLTGYWRGRQVADALGMPYDVYIEWALHYRLRNWQQRWLPRPDQLYGEWDVEKVQIKWEELQASTLYRSEHPAYLIQNYDDIPHQNDYHEWLFKQADLRSDPVEMLAMFVESEQLPIEKVTTRLDGLMLERFQRFAR